MSGDERWEYWTGFLWAYADDEKAKRDDWASGERLPKYSPQALIPDLDALGAQGWELVHMEPVVVGDNHDVLMLDTMRTWTNSYFCVFKRPRSR